MLKNASIRNKLVLSNMLMIFIPVVVIIILVAGTTSMLTYFSSSKFSVDPTFGSFLLYETQFNASKIENEMKKSASGEERQLGKMERSRADKAREGITASGTGVENFITDNVLLECVDVQQEGSEILILANNEIIYKTQGAEVYNLVNAIFDISTKNFSDIDHSFVVSNKNGTVISNVFELENFSRIKIIIINEDLKAIVGANSDNALLSIPLKGDTILTLVVIAAAIVIIVTNGVLVIFVIKSIMEPLEKLKTATHELKDGNLDYKIDYMSQNEIGQVCADFEKMRLQLKASVEQQQRYEENRMELIAGISHDLGTPLTTIKGYASGIMDGIADTPEKRDRYLKIIYDTAGDMDKLVSELSMLSKLSLDKIPFYFEKVNAKSFFDDVSENIKSSLENDGIAFEYSCDCDENKSISVAKDQFRRVITNLVDNCKKYKNSSESQNKARLIVSDMPQGGVLLMFEDNGVGVSDGEFEKIFDSFYRSDKARSNAKNGSGLGLAITKQIIDRHGATITAQASELGGLAILISMPEINTEEKG